MSLLNKLLLLLAVFPLAMCTQQPADSEDEGSVEGDKKVNPNIIVIYADDLGFGDLSSYGASELSTPNIDRIANEGIKFTNGYASSATCTPSRYGKIKWQEF